MSSPPLIAHVIHHLVMGGMENGLVNLLNRIPSSRYRQCVICVQDFSDFRDRITANNVEVFALHKSELTRIGLYRAMLKLFRQLRPTIVHSRNLSGLDALPAAWTAGVPIRIHGEHGWDVTDLEGTRLRPRLLRRVHSPMVHRYIAVSKDLQRYLVENVGISPARITQIYNGVDTARFAPAGAQSDDRLPPHFRGPGKVVIGAVGRLQPVKDPLTLVRGVAELLRREPGLRDIVRLAIIGDGPLREALHKCVADEGIADMTWLPGARNDVAEIYRCLDIFVLPSLREGVSNTLLEAMASGLPVIATAVGGNPELVVDDVSGFLIEPSSPQGLAAKLQKYVADAGLRSRHGNASRERAVALFGLETMVDSHVALYDSLCSQRLHGRGA
jgi:sugar transferase (PEP-CTERM/EpsH1 system associated)